MCGNSDKNCFRMSPLILPDDLNHLPARSRFVMPSLISAMWKLISKPSRLSPSRRYVRSLLLVDWGDQLDGFDLDDNLIFDHQMGLESGVDTDILIGHRNRLLAHLPETPAAKFIAACLNFLAKSPSREKARQV